MGRLKMCVVYDSKVEAFMHPMFFRSKGEALRTWQMSVNDDKPGNLFCSHPADYTMFEIGEYDEDNGVVLMHSAKVNYGTALEHKSVPAQQLPLNLSGQQGLHRGGEVAPEVRLAK